MKDLPLRSLKIAITIAFIGTLVATAFMSPVAQSQTYHRFADVRGLVDIPNAWNVLSNLAFLCAGALGLAVMLYRRPPGATRAWIALFAAVVLVAPGSAFYHAAPNDATLTWDRFPMAVSFMALLVAVCAESLRPSLERLLLPLGVTGVASVLYWRWSGDLRLYLWVQIFPFLAVLITLAARRGTFDHRTHLPWAIGCYIAAKFAELGDAEIFDATGGVVSGHTLKHLASAAGVFFLVRMLTRRGKPDLPVDTPVKQGAGHSADASP